MDSYYTILFFEKDNDTPQIKRVNSYGQLCAQAEIIEKKDGEVINVVHHTYDSFTKKWNKKVVDSDSEYDSRDESESESSELEDAPTEPSISVIPETPEISVCKNMPFEVKSLSNEPIQMPNLEFKGLSGECLKPQFMECLKPQFMEQKIESTPLPNKDDEFKDMFKQFMQYQMQKDLKIQKKEDDEKIVGGQYIITKHKKDFHIHLNGGCLNGKRSSDASKPIEFEYKC